MNVEISNVSQEELQQLLSQMRALEFENNRLRSEIVHPNTPIPANPTVEKIKMDYKVIPRPEKFNGERKGSKVREFCRKIRRYLKCLVNVDKSMHVDLIAGFLVGPADTWFNRWEKTHPDSSVDEILNALVSHFSPSNLAQEARRRLCVIKQQGSVQKYSEKFREYLEDIDDIEDLEAKTYFINGLKDQIKKEVRLRDLNDDQTLDEVEHIALQIDSILFARDMPRFDYKARPVGQSTGVTPMQGIQFGNLTRDQAKKYSEEKRCWKCHKQLKHAEGCTSRYTFKSNVLQAVGDEKTSEEPVADE